MPTTYKVRDIGRVTAVVGNPTTIHSTNNGKVAIQVDSTEFLGNHGQNHSSSGRSYLVADLSTITSKLKNNSGEIKVGSNLGWKLTGQEGKREILEAKFINSANGTPPHVNWIKTEVEGKQRVLPKIFYDEKTVNYPFESNKDYFLSGFPRPVRFNTDLISYQQYGRKRLWWGYPAQILLPPAIVLDLLTLPLSILAGPW